MISEEQEQSKRIKKTKKTKKITNTQKTINNTIENSKENEKPPLKNIIRTLSASILDFFKERNIIVGYYYFIIHCILIIVGICIIVFDNTLLHLIIILIIVTLDGIANVIVHECPLTILEQKYLGTSIVQKRIKTFQNMDICYTAEDSYESTFELIVNIWSIIVLKICCIICMRYFLVKQITPI